MTTTLDNPVRRRAAIYWMGDIPPVCEVSGRAIIDVFIDGAHPVHRVWACWHPASFVEAGGLLGTGQGQQYERQADGRFMRTKG
jgi:hypothetical protein